MAICSSGLRLGKSEGIVRASMVLPVPGGPDNSKLCCPATAMINARLAWA